MISGQKFRIKATIPDGCSKVTVMNGLVSHFRTPIVEVDKHADILFHYPRPLSSLFELVETCSGIGALGCGAKYAGWTVKAHNDIAPTFCSHMSKHAQAPVIQGDICRLETVAELHRAAPQAGTYAFGFSCQPFSSLGDQRQGNDPRANTLPYGLYSAYLMQKDLIILECVPNAAQSQWVQRCLQQHQQATKGERSEILLELNDFWPSKRRRWWTILTPSFMGKTLLRAFPRMQGLPSVACVIPHPLDLPVEENDQLVLSQDERRQFQLYSKGLAHQMVDFAEAMPTALHSWGNQCIPCRCGCRGALSEARLSEHGLHGALMPSPSEDTNRSIRHVSPKELCILVGFPKVAGFDDDPRLLLAGIGQLASPLQSAWVFAHLRNQLVDSQLSTEPMCSPNQVLASVIADLLALRDQWFGDYVTVPMQVFQSNLEQALGVPIPESPLGALPIADVPPDHATQVLDDHTAEDQVDMHDAHDEDVHEPIATSGDAAMPPVPMDPIVDHDHHVDHTPMPAHAMVPANDPPLTHTVNDDTGAVSGFASTPNPVTHEPDESTHAISPTLPMPVEEEDPAKEIASSILQGSIVIIDMDERQVHMLKIPTSATVKDLIAADNQLTHTGVLYHNCLGHQLPPETFLTQHQLLLKSGTHISFPLDLMEIAVGNVHRVRQDALLHQGSAVAVDEMTYYLVGLGKSMGTHQVEPLIIHDLCDFSSVLFDWWEQVRSSRAKPVVSAMLYKSHWIPMVIHPGDQPKVVTTDEGAKELQPMLQTRACEWRFLFWQHLLTQEPAMTGFMPLGGHPELETAIAAMLREHGVFPERVMERSKAVINSLGSTTVTQLLHAPKPWQALKDRANKHVPRIRLIHEDEFEQMVKGRPKNKPLATQKTQGRSHNKMQSPAFTISPSDVAIPDGVFRQADGTAVGQLQVRQITPASRGVVVLTEVEFQPFKAQQPVSKEGLGMLIPMPCSPEVEKLGKTVRFPVQSVASGEPMLISAVLVQRGSIDIQRSTPQQQIQVEQVETQTVKILLYRDQCPLPWEQVVDKPVRSLLDLMPCLKVCKTPKCSCQAWHPDGTSSEPLLDVWQRDFLNIHFKKSKPAEAAMMVCMMRVTDAAFRIIQQGSGSDGVFVEARTHDGKQHDGTQHTVWLQKMTYEEARAAQTKIEVPSCLVRVTYRYGLRVATQSAQEVHEKFRPQEPFLASSVKSTWIVGPMPWGTTRQALIKLFAKWSWCAKPLQTAGIAADRTGLKWHVVADSPPPNYVYNLAHGDVLIVQAAAPTPTPQSSVHVEASMHTQQLMKPSRSPVPLAEDPWADAAQRLPHVENLGRQITTNGTQLRDHFDSQMKSQMDRIEELLAKRHKHE
eukprot:Skav219582  [mRNA]  locus=scaffold249:234653:239093:+ [translate_table: standard]